MNRREPEGAAFLTNRDGGRDDSCGCVGIRTTLVGDIGGKGVLCLWGLGAEEVPVLCSGMWVGTFWHKHREEEIADPEQSKPSVVWTGASFIGQEGDSLEKASRYMAFVDKSPELCGLPDDDTRSLLAFSIRFLYTPQTL